MYLVDTVKIKKRQIEQEILQQEDLATKIDLIQDVLQKTVQEGGNRKFLERDL